jgi:hypothetical protein
MEPQRQLKIVLKPLLGAKLVLRNIQRMPKAILPHPLLHKHHIRLPEFISHLLQMPHLFVFVIIIPRLALPVLKAGK